MKTNALARRARSLRLLALSLAVAALALISADFAQSCSVQLGQLASGQLTSPPVSTLGVGDYLSAAAR